VPVIKARTELRPDWRNAPLAFWVHEESTPGSWYGTTTYAPAAPKPRGRRGYLYLIVEFGRDTLEFSSREQLDHFVDVLSMNPLPTSRRLSALRGVAKGPNGHWLSRLPAALKATRKRAELVQALKHLPADVWRATPDIPSRTPRMMKKLPSSRQSTRRKS
jgi:hypothetical protein